MRLRPHIIVSNIPVSIALFLFLAASFSAQRLAIVTPNKTMLDERIASEVTGSLLESARVQDHEMTEAAFESARPENPFNMTVEDARRIGSVIGCDLYIAIRTGTQKRASLDKPDYYEAFAALFTISSRTGRLVDWRLLSEKGETASGAEIKLSNSVPPVTLDILKRVKSIVSNEIAETIPPAPEGPPDPKSPGAKGYREPVPYRRIKPLYTQTAYLYDVTATVEITVDLDETGRITRTEITRWAGYGLDESVRAAVMTMNWRAAERNGKPLPARFLLRYNFKKIDKDDPDNE
jgi:hypothetical protein